MFQKCFHILAYTAKNNNTHTVYDMVINMIYNSILYIIPY